MNLEIEIINKQIGGYTAIRFIDRGASALVFEALDPMNRRVALKVFDPDFLKKHGGNQQVQRIERQLQLKGKHHDNLVDILDGGKCTNTGLHFIVMPFVDAPNLAKVILKVPRERIRPVIAQIAAAAEYLDKLKIYHRDIKPANVAVSGNNFDKATLLDLGVIMPLGLGELTDATDARPFIATTQYSPPEFLVRDEEETEDGYRAVTFYQLGAVLHDLLMRRPIFQDKLVTYAKLVKAVLLEDPIIDCRDAPLHLIRLARNCLLKDPAKRLRLVSWDMFRDVEPVARSKEDLRKHILALRSAIPTDTGPSTPQLSRVADAAGKALGDALKQATLDDRTIFPPATFRTLHRGTDASTFVISFAPSARLGTNQYLHCVFRVRATGASPSTFEISFAAASSNTPLDTLPADAPLKVIGQEIRDGEGTELCVNKLYESIDAAVEGSVSGSASSGDAPLNWLPGEGD